MIKKIQTFISLFIAQIAVVASLGAPMALAQQTPNTANVACGSTGTIVGCTESNTKDTTADQQVQNLIRSGIRIFQIIVGLISVFMIITAGLKYITSGGESGKVGEAKNAILYAVIGLVVVAIAEIIVQFALNRSFAPANGI